MEERWRGGGRSEGEGANEYVRTLDVRFLVCIAADDGGKKEKGRGAEKIPAYYISIFIPID
jgi:hypothetical protein